MNLNGTEWVLSLLPRESVCLLECVPQLEWCLGRNVLGDGDDSFVTYDVTASLYSGFSSKCQLDVYKSSWAGSSAIQEEALREPIIPITVYSNQFVRYSRYSCSSTVQFFASTPPTGRYLFKIY